MARDNRKIVRAVRMPGTTVDNKRMPGQTFKEGQEDELAVVLSKERIAELVENGSLEGDWGTDKPAPKDPKAK